MMLEVGCAQDRNQIAMRLSRNLKSYLSIHMEKGFSAFKDEWEANHLWQGKAVTLLAGASALEGIVIGVDGVGALRLQVADQVRVFSGGELSLRLRVSDEKRPVG